MRPATAIYRKPAAAKARAYGSAPMARRSAKKATIAPSTEASPVARFSNSARCRENPGVHQQGKVPDAVRNLVGRDGKGRDEAQRDVVEKRGRNQHAIEGVVDAVTDQYQDARGTLAVRVHARRGVCGCPSTRTRARAYATTAPVSR